MGLFQPPVHTPIARTQERSLKFLFKDFVMAEVGVVETKLPFGAAVPLRNGIFARNKHVRDIISVDGASKRSWSNCVGDLNVDISLPVGQTTCLHTDPHFQS